MKEKLAEVDVDGSVGFEVIDVLGASLSSVQVQVAGVGSVPAALVDRTEKVCEASASPFSDVGEVQAA